MKITSSNNTIKIIGNIKSVRHYNDIKAAIDVLVKDYNQINLYLLNSISITSSVIGYLCKLIDKGHLIELYIANEDLHELLDDLNLLQTFKVQQIAI